MINAFLFPWAEEMQRKGSPSWRTRYERSIAELEERNRKLEEHRYKAEIELAQGRDIARGAEPPSQGFSCRPARKEAALRHHGVQHSIGKGISLSSTELL